MRPTSRSGIASRIYHAWAATEKVLEQKRTMKGIITEPVQVSFSAPISFCVDVSDLMIPYKSISELRSVGDSTFYKRIVPRSARSPKEVSDDVVNTLGITHANFLRDIGLPNNKLPVLDNMEMTFGNSPRAYFLSEELARNPWTHCDHRALICIENLSEGNYLCVDANRDGLVIQIPVPGSPLFGDGPVEIPYGNNITNLAIVLAALQFHFDQFQPGDARDEILDRNNSFFTDALSVLGLSAKEENFWIRVWDLYDMGA